MQIILPRLYAIVDAEVPAQRGVAIVDFASQLRDAGVTLVQYRDKPGSPQRMLEQAGLLRNVFRGEDCRLMMNDRADLAVLAGFDGVHVGQGDLPVGAAKVVLERAPHPFAKGAKGWGTRGLGIVGVSTHVDAQVVLANATDADYVAIGPVFGTSTKLNAAPVVGLEGVRRARALTAKPLVAIGGITRENCRSVLDAGADCVAVISGFFAPNETVEQVVRDFLRILR